MSDQKRSMSKQDMLHLSKHWAVYCMDAEKSVDFSGCCRKQRKITQNTYVVENMIADMYMLSITSEKTVIATSRSLVNFNCG